MFLGKDFLKICSKFTEHPCRSTISVKMESSFIEIILQHGCYSVNLQQIFRISFPKNASGGLLFYLLYLLGVHWAVFVKNDDLLLVPTEKVLHLGFLNAFSKSLIKYAKICFLCNPILEKDMGIDQKPRWSSCLVIEVHIFKVMLLFLHGCHTQ